MRRFLPVFAFVLTSQAVLPQTPSAPPRNLIGNGGFEQFVPTDNVWDGVDADGYIAGFKQGVSVLSESGGIGNMAMPVSVNAVDMNGDSAPDIVMADPQGYYRIFFNAGTKEQPQFTSSEVIPVFLSRETIWRGDLRRAPRINMFDWKRAGKLDLTIGNYIGDILIVPNQGSASAPDFRQPPKYEAAEIRTTKAGNTWGNVFAPFAFDWNKDGKPDLLIGEGSYSANAIHLLLNQGAAFPPQFGEENRSYLVYGDGREQLTPSVVDYNGDGIPDVLVADRTGVITVHYGAADWQPGKELAVSGTLKFGASTSLAA